MNFITKIFKTIKSILLMPVNISSISKIMEDLKQIEDKIDLLTKKVNDLYLNPTLERQYSLPSYHDLSESEKLSILQEISNVAENNFLQIEALLSIYNSLPNMKFVPTTRGWAGSPDFLNKIVEIILKQKPHFVCEASSGVSTVVIGLALKMNNLGKALSLEHDSFYAEKSRNNIIINEIEDFSIIMNCPLNDCLIGKTIWKWYDIHELTFTDKIDLLIIDGPPRITQNLARFPAIPLLYKYFSDNVIIILDDANRPDEIIIVEKWIDFLEKEGCKINIEKYPHYEKGLVVMEITKNKPF